MQTIDIIIAGALEGEFSSHQEGDLRVDFHKWAGEGDLQSVENPHWSFVDWLLPEMSGLEICRRLRCNPRTANTHITLILDEDDLEMRRRALRAGADDYMVGPATREAILRRALASRQSSAETGAAASLVAGDLAIDLSAYQARWQGRPVPLMPNEFRLLRHFVENSGRIFTRSQLITALAKQVPPVDERTVDVWIVRLRRALRAAGANVPLRTVRSLGYVLDRV